MEEEQREYTTGELEERFGIGRMLVYAWSNKLLAEGWGRKLDSSGHGTWLINAKGVEFLRSRVGRVGRPKEEVDGIAEGEGGC